MNWNSAEYFAKDFTAMLTALHMKHEEDRAYYAWYNLPIHGGWGN